jgi:glycosyltransferase involved in cell wall biosynthesis
MDGGAEKFITTLMTGLKGSLKSIYLVATDLDTKFSTIRRPYTFSQYADFVYDLEKTMHPEDFANFVNCLGARESRMHYLNIGSQWLYRYLNSYPNQLVSSGKLIDVLFNPFGSLSQHAKVKHSFTDTVFVYSALESYARENHLSAGQLHTIYVGIGRDNPVKRKTSDELTIGWLGRFSPEKRPEWFIELAKVFNKDARFKMAGTGALLASIQESSFNMPSLEVLGFVNDTKSFLEGINLLVISSEMEGISLSAMEAISSGIPIISTDVGGMSDLVINGVNGYLVPSNLMSLTSAINAILADPEGFWKISDFVGSHGLDSKFDENYMIESFKSILN